MSYTIPYTFVPGTKARAQEVNANFTSVIDSIDDLDSKKINTDLSNISEDGIQVIKNNAVSRNIGEIFFTSFPLSDSGVHLLDGAIINEDGIYKDFIKRIRTLYNANPGAGYFCTEAQWQSSVSTYGVCGKFVYDSTNNTVRLPKYGTQIFTKSSILNKPSTIPVYGNGKVIGLTNGTVNYGWTVTDNTENNYQFRTGAFGQNLPYTGANAGDRPGTAGIGLTTSGNNSGIVANISALSLTDYNVDGYYYIVVASSTKTDIQIDIDNIATDLNGKADTDLTNVTNTGNIQMAGASMPSNTYTALTVGASDTQYTAPSNGWYSFALKVTNTSYCHIGLYNTSKGWIGYKSTIYNGQNNTLRVLLPVLKGDIIAITYTPNSTNFDLRFVYAQGSESEAN